MKNKENKLEHILMILEAELRYVDKNSDFNKGVYNTLEHVIQIIKAHKNAGTRSMKDWTGFPQA
jgi:hypothetical protein